MLRLAGATDLVDASLSRANEQWEENNALQDEADVRFGTTAAQMEIIRNAFAEIQREVGEAFLPVIREALDYLVAVLPTLIETEIGPFLEGLARGIQAFLEFVQPALAAAREASEDLRGGANAVELLTEAVAGLTMARRLSGLETANEAEALAAAQEGYFETAMSVEQWQARIETLIRFLVAEGKTLQEVVELTGLTRDEIIQTGAAWELVTASVEGNTATIDAWIDRATVAAEGTRDQAAALSELTGAIVNATDFTSAYEAGLERVSDDQDPRDALGGAPGGRSPRAARRGSREPSRAPTTPATRSRAPARGRGRRARR